jgi:CRP/FNR family nitrogen fixation transcriptional regulator
MLHWKSEVGATRGSPFPALNGVGKADQAPDAISGLAGPMSATRDFPPDAEIFSQYEEVSDVYSVVSGAVRFSRLLRDGRRQIGAFYFPGDLFGLESEERHSFSAESIVNCKIRITKRKAFIQAAMSNQAYAREVWSETAAHLQRAQGHMSLLGRMTARERMAAFLLDIDARLDAGGSINLPMPRRDIADYLGLTIETVSRMFTHLERTKIIAIATDARHIVLCNPAALHQLDEC